MSKGVKKINVLIACGGTGGHVFPGIAIGEAWKRIRPDADLLFAGTPRGLEGRIVPQKGWKLISMGSTSIKDRSGAGKIAAYLRLPFSLFGAMRILHSIKPDCVVGIGGYAAGPLTMAAALMSLPNAIVEPNAIAGMTNRILGKFTRRVYTGFAEAKTFFASQKVFMTGNPVREEIMNLRNLGSVNHDAVTIFCFGGSQGATAINRALIDALPRLSESKKKYRFIHQVGGREDISEIKASYAQFGYEADVFEFTDKIWESYAKADVVIARAGATTAAEVCVIGLPTIFVPYPHAADDHQRANAAAVARSGGAVVIMQNELNGEKLASEILKLTPDRLAMMRTALTNIGRPDAAEKIVRDLLKLMGEKENVQ